MFAFELFFRHLMRFDGLPVANLIEFQCEEESASFINIVEAGKFPACFGQFKNEANRCVFAVVWSLPERAIDLIPPV